MAAVGLASIARWLWLHCRGLGKPAAAGIVFALFATVNFFPYYAEPDSSADDGQDSHFVASSGSAFGYMHALVAQGYTMQEEQVYSAPEHEFVEKVKKAIPDGALVINQPHDGSVFAYGLDGLNTYYRHIDLSTETPESLIVRSRLKDASNDEEVRRILDDLGASYVLQLDAGEGPSESEGSGSPEKDGQSVWLLQTNEDNWGDFSGINQITDETPGFEVVLADGDMRLYKITE